MLGGKTCKHAVTELGHATMSSHTWQGKIGSQLALKHFPLTHAPQGEACSIYTMTEVGPVTHKLRKVAFGSQGVAACSHFSEVGPAMQLGG